MIRLVFSNLYRVFIYINTAVLFAELYLQDPSAATTGMTIRDTEAGADTEENQKGDEVT